MSIEDNNIFIFNLNLDLVIVVSTCFNSTIAFWNITVLHKAMHYIKVTVK